MLAQDNGTLIDVFWIKLRNRVSAVMMAHLVSCEVVQSVCTQ